LIWIIASFRTSSAYLASPWASLASFLLPQISWAESLIGIVVGGGSLLAIAMGYQFITGKEGMGGGDIKLLAMIGAFLGWKGVFFHHHGILADRNRCGHCGHAASRKRDENGAAFRAILGLGGPSLSFPRHPNYQLVL
jgi:prepilin signal peptidase PulO-like enzyme (type II secretory pathway)